MGIMTKIFRDYFSELVDFKLVLGYSVENRNFDTDYPIEGDIATVYTSDVIFTGLCNRGKFTITKVFLENCNGSKN